MNNETFWKERLEESREAIRELSEQIAILKEEKAQWLLSQQTKPEKTAEMYDNPLRDCMKDKQELAWANEALRRELAKKNTPITEKELRPNGRTAREIIRQFEADGSVEYKLDGGSKNVFTYNEEKVISAMNSFASQFQSSPGNSSSLAEQADMEHFIKYLRCEYELQQKRMDALGISDDQFFEQRVTTAIIFAEKYKKGDSNSSSLRDALENLTTFLTEYSIHVGTDGSLNADLDCLITKAKAALNNTDQPKTDKI